METDQQRSPGDQIEMTRRRILLLTNVFPSPWLPTKGTFNFELARSVARRHTLRVINPISWFDEWQAGRKAAQRLDGQRSEIREAVHVAYPRFYYPPKILHPHYDRFLDGSLPRKLRREIAAFQPEAVVGYWTHPDGTVAVRWARALGAAAWVMVGGSDVLLLAEEPRRAAKLRATLMEADGVFVLSNDLRTHLLDWGVPPSRVHVFRRGIDRHRFSPADPRVVRERLGLSSSLPVLVWAGRMVPVKGLEVLLAAAGKLVERGEKFQLHLIGDGPVRGTIERDIAERGLSDHVHLIGSVAHDQLADWYRAADWTVLSSHSEGIPNVLLESHACGTPFVATDVGGVSEIVQPGLDRLAVAGDVDALADQLSAALALPSLDTASRAALAATVPSLAEAADVWIGHIFS